MSKLKLTLATLALTFITTQGWAQETQPQPQPQPSTPDATDAVVGVWGTAYSACVSQYGTYRPYYPVYMEIMHTRTEFMMRSQIRNEACRIEGTYSMAEKSVNYQAKAQQCATAKLSEELKSMIEEGYMLITLSSEIADKICPVRNSTLRVYLTRR